LEHGIDVGRKKSPNPTELTGAAPVVKEQIQRWSEGERIPNGNCCPPPSASDGVSGFAGENQRQHVRVRNQDDDGPHNGHNPRKHEGVEDVNLRP
jgi:hypothetical protein